MDGFSHGQLTKMVKRKAVALAEREWDGYGRTLATVIVVGPDVCVKFVPQGMD